MLLKCSARSRLRALHYLKGLFALHFTRIGYPSKRVRKYVLLRTSIIPTAYSKKVLVTRFYSIRRFGLFMRRIRSQDKTHVSSLLWTKHKELRAAVSTAETNKKTHFKRNSKKSEFNVTPDLKMQCFEVAGASRRKDFFSRFSGG